MARYAGLLLAPAEGFGLRPKGFFALRAKKKAKLCCFGQFRQFLVSSSNLSNFQYLVALKIIIIKIKIKKSKNKLKNQKNSNKSKKIKNPKKIQKIKKKSRKNEEEKKKRKKEKKSP